MDSGRPSREGLIFALMTYLTWGVVPIYFKWLSEVPPFELVAHRLIWSLVFLLGLLTLTNSWKDMRVSWPQLRVLAATSLLLGGNWLIFIWAILNDNITETALGYYINPLLSVVLGMVFLRERLRPLQWIAVLLASMGIIYQLIFYGQIPWIALSLALMFGFYGLLRKKANLPSFAGLTIECLWLLPIAVIYLSWLAFNDQISMGTKGMETDLLLMASGIVTSFPLLCFAAAVTRLPLSTMGFLQYIAPSASLIIAVLMYDEPFGSARLVTFSCIWVALILFATESMWHQKRVEALSKKAFK